MTFETKEQAWYGDKLVTIERFNRIITTVSVGTKHFCVTTQHLKKCELPKAQQINKLKAYFLWWAIPLAMLLTLLAILI